MKLRSASAVLLIAVLLPIATLACSPNETTTETGFGIYLIDTGGTFTLERELIISDEDIASYNASTYEIKLNEAGIEKWNSYITGTPPTLDKSLFSKDFSVRLNGSEMYRGEFWSAASSTAYNGITIEDALFKLDSGNNTISIGYNCIDPRDDWRIIDFFETGSEQSSFELYLVEPGELMISNQDIKSYNASTHEIELNADGIERWNSFFPEPWSQDGRQFMVKVDGQEVYRGSFLSAASSVIPFGEAAIFSNFDDEYTKISIDYYYPYDPRDNPDIIDFFAGKGLLE